MDLGGALCKGYKALLKVGNDAFLFPIAIAGCFRSYTATLFGWQGRFDLGQTATFFGFGQGPLARFPDFGRDFGFGPGFG